jgi:hypothetical protein
MNGLAVAPLVRRLHASGQTERAETLVAGLRGVERMVGTGYVELAGRTTVPSRRAFEAALELDPTRADARAGLVLAGRGRGEVPDGLTPRERAVGEGWGHVAAGDPAAVRALEADLAAWEPGELLWEDALRLRLAWRVASGDPRLAAEALELSTRVLRASPAPPDLVERAAAARAAGRPDFAWGALDVLAEWLRGPRRPDLARAALAIADALPPDERAEGVRAALEAHLR